MARQRDIITILSDHEAGLRRIKATLARIGSGGVPATADAWTTARTITLSGDVSGVSPAWDGSGNLAFTGLVVADDSHAHTNYLPLTGGTLSGTLYMNARLSVVSASGGQIEHVHPSSGSVVIDWEDDYLRYRFGGTSTPAGIRIDDYDGVSIELNRNGSAYFAGSVTIGVVGTQNSLYMPWADTTKYASGGWRTVVSTGEDLLFMVDLATGSYVSNFRVQDEGGFITYDNAGDVLNSVSSAGILYSKGNYYLGGTQLFFDYDSATNNYLHIPNTSDYFRIVLDGSEQLRLTTAGYLSVAGSRIYMGIGSNDYLRFTEATNVFQFVADASGYKSVVHAHEFVAYYDASNYAQFTSDSSSWLHLYLVGLTNGIALNSRLVTTTDGDLGSATYPWGNIWVMGTYTYTVGGTYRTVRVEPDGAYGYVSSSELTKDIHSDVTYSQAIKGLSALTPMRYSPKGRAKGETWEWFGFTAESALPVFPEVVMGVGGAQEEMSLEYEMLVVPLTAVVVGQEVRIDAIEDRLAQAGL